MAILQQIGILTCRANTNILTERAGAPVLHGISEEIHKSFEMCSDASHRVQTELLATFSPSGDSPDKSDESPSTLSAVTLIPRSNPGESLYHSLMTDSRT